MASNTEPSEPPPSYSVATDSTSSNPNQSTNTSTSASHLQVPGLHRTRNGIPPNDRRSMEDESRSLPDGWIRQYDPETHHQFFVQTTATPPRSIWHHPYDDATYLSSLPHSERERIRNLHEVPSRADIEAESSDDDREHDQHQNQNQSAQNGGRRFADGELPPRAGNNNGEEQPKGISKVSRRLKDKLTSSTHTEREAARLRRAQEEQRAYEQHMHTRRQLSKAMETGQPQLLGTDREGRNVYIEPPMTGGMGMGGFGGRGPYGGNGYGVNPYAQGPYRQDPHGRYLRPQMPYGRPYGAGYGGGMGLPLLGGLGGGMLLGGLLF